MEILEKLEIYLNTRLYHEEEQFQHIARCDISDHVAPTLY